MIQYFFAMILLAITSTARADDVQDILDEFERMSDQATAQQAASVDAFEAPVPVEAATTPQPKATKPAAQRPVSGEINLNGINRQIPENSFLLGALRNAGKTDGIFGSGPDPIILGALDKSLIDNVIDRNMTQIRYCYQRELTKNPMLGGKVTVKFVIAKDGSVSSATTKSSTMNNNLVDGCICHTISRLKFPEPKGGGIVIVSYPFIFSPG